MRELPEKRRDDNIILNEIIRIAKLEGVKFNPEINRAMQGINKSIENLIKRHIKEGIEPIEHQDTSEGYLYYQSMYEAANKIYVGNLPILKTYRKDEDLAPRKEDFETFIRPYIDNYAEIIFRVINNG